MFDDRFRRYMSKIGINLISITSVWGRKIQYGSAHENEKCSCRFYFPSFLTYCTLKFTERDTVKLMNIHRLLTQQVTRNKDHKVCFSGGSNTVEIMYICVVYICNQISTGSQLNFCLGEMGSQDVCSSMPATSLDLTVLSTASHSR
jgi:hypothetical protein